MKRLLVVNPVDAPEYHERWAVWQDLAEATRRQLPSVELAVGGRDAFLGAQGLHAVHLNFLESVVGAEGPTERNMAVLAARFEELHRTGVRVILTRHDIANLWGTPGYERLYRLAYTSADVVVHLGRHSLEDFQRRRDSVHAGARASHVVIPQPVPSRLTPADRAAARGALGITADRVVVLVFGTIRSSREMAFALSTFRRLSCPGKLLVTTRARFPGGRLGYKLLRAFHGLRGDTRFRDELVPERDVPLYFGAADVVLLQRIEEPSLNSAVLVLGLALGNVVVGTRHGVIGELLQETGNPAFDPAAPDSAVAALQAGLALQRAGKGLQNRAHALSHWGVDAIASRYADLYARALAGG